MHVDDGMLACPTLAHAEKFVGKQGLGANRVLTWGPLDKMLGASFDTTYTKDKRVIFMHQQEYAANLVRRAGMAECKKVLTPAVPGRKYTKEDGPKTMEEVKALEGEGMTVPWYKSTIASTNYLRSITRPDLAFAQGKNAKFSNNPGKINYMALKHQVRFINSTQRYGIEFKWEATDPEPMDGPLTITCFSDSSFADDVDTGKSTVGNIIKVNGATIMVRSKLSSRPDSCVNHSELDAFKDIAEEDSTTTDKVDAFMHASRSLTWVLGVKAALEGRLVSSIPSTPVQVDNAGVMAVIRDRTMKSTNRHIYRAIYEIRDRVHREKIVHPVKIGTKDNVANALTKQEAALRQSAEQLRCIAGPSSLSVPE